MFYRADDSIKGTGFIGDHQKFQPSDSLYDMEHQVIFPRNFAYMPEEGSSWDPNEIINILYGEIPFNRPDLWKRFINYYYNCLRDVDRHINTVIESLKATDQLDNTIIFMISDHGELLGQHGTRGKIAFWEESVRVPTLVYHPDLGRSNKCESIISNIDFVPTILEFAGLSNSQIANDYPELKGNSFASLVENVNSYNRRDEEGHLIQGVQIIPSVFDVNEKVRQTGLAEGYYEKLKAFATKGSFLPDFSLPYNYKAVVDQRYKFVRSFSPRANNNPQDLRELFEKNESIQLFDLKNDPYEMQDLANDRANDDLLLKMNNKLNYLVDKEIGLENHVVHLPGPDWFWTM
jgi:arylsulfatase